MINNYIPVYSYLSPTAFIPTGTKPRREQLFDKILKRLYVDVDHNRNEDERRLLEVLLASSLTDSTIEPFVAMLEAIITEATNVITDANAEMQFRLNTFLEEKKRDVIQQQTNVRDVTHQLNVLVKTYLMFLTNRGNFRDDLLNWTNRRSMPNFFSG